MKKRLKNGIILMQKRVVDFGLSRLRGQGGAIEKIVAS